MKKFLSFIGKIIKLKDPDYGYNQSIKGNVFFIDSNNDKTKKRSKRGRLNQFYDFMFCD
jgi:hypothetical protein